MSVLLFSLILVLLIAVCFACAHLCVRVKNKAVLHAFKELDKDLKTRYGLILDIVNNIKGNQSLIDEIMRIRAEVIMLGVKRDNIDRRIALDSELERIMDIAISENSNQDNETLIKEYRENSKVVLKSMKNYNLKAMILNHAVSVFPESFVCRLGRVKPLDLFRI